MQDLPQKFIEEVENFITRLTPDKHLLYIIQPCSIGDFLYTGGLAHAVQAKKKKSATVLVVKERMKNLGITYPNFAGIIFLPKDTINSVMNYCKLTANYEGDNWIYGHFHVPYGKIGGGYMWDSNLHLIGRYKKDVFNIPLDTPFMKPIVPQISEENIAALNEKYVLDKDKTIIIMPYVHSTKQLDIKFWEVLAQILNEKNYIVYTNVDGFSEKPIKGTKPITSTFPELSYIADKVKCFIGSRNGIFDFLALTNAKTININPYPDWMYEIGVLFPNANNRTFYNAMDYMSPILKSLPQDEVNIEIRLHHRHIRDKDVCYSYEDILNGILAEVNKN